MQRKRFIRSRPIENAATTGVCSDARLLPDAAAGFGNPGEGFVTDCVDSRWSFDSTLGYPGEGHPRKRFVPKVAVKIVKAVAKGVSRRALARSRPSGANNQTHRSSANPTIEDNRTAGMSAAMSMARNLPYTGGQVKGNFKPTIKNPRKESVQNARAFVNGLAYPFSSGPYRMPSPNTEGTTCYTSVVQGQTAGITATGSSVTSVAAIVVLPYVTGSLGVLATMTGDKKETYTVTDDPFAATAIANFAEIRCVGMGVRVWAATPNDTSNNGALTFGMLDYDSSQIYLEQSTNQYVQLSRTIDGFASLPSQATALSPGEIAWLPQAIDGSVEINQITVGVAPVVDMRGLSWQSPIAAAESLFRSDTAIVAVLVAGTNGAQAMNYEIIRHYECIPAASNVRLFDPQICFGSSSDIDMAFARLPAMVRQAGVSCRAIPQIVYPYAGVTMSGLAGNRTISTCYLVANALGCSPDLDSICSAVRGLKFPPPFSRYRRLRAPASDDDVSVISHCEVDGKRSIQRRRLLQELASLDRDFIPLWVIPVRALGVVTILMVLDALWGGGQFRV